MHSLEDIELVCLFVCWYKTRKTILRRKVGGKPRILNFLVHPNFFSFSRTVLGEDEVFLEKVSFSRTVLEIFFLEYHRKSPRSARGLQKVPESSNGKRSIISQKRPTF